MAEMTTSGSRKTINEMVRLSYVLAGLLEETQTLTAVGGGGLAREFLETIVDDLQSIGISARATSFHPLTLTANTYEYTMPSTVLDVYGDAMYIAADEADVTKASSETVVTQASAEQWQTLGSKSTTGRPVLYFPWRVQTPPKVRLWPIPDEAGTVRFQVHRHLYDNSDGNANVDLEVYWTSYIMYELAAQLAEAKTMPDVKVSRLNAKARAKKAEARAMSSSRTDVQCHITHGSGRRR